jgi:uncharacterized lipoprotein YbaY
MAQETPLLCGEVIFEGTRPFTDATVYVRLEDVSRLDAPSTVIAEQMIRHVSHPAGSQQRLAFSLYGQLPDDQASYIVQVHVDVDGDGRVSSGDYRSMESYPVLTHGYPNQVTVRVREVK